MAPRSDSNVPPICSVESGFCRPGLQVVESPPTWVHAGPREGKITAGDVVDSLRWSPVAGVGQAGELEGVTIPNHGQSVGVEEFRGWREMSTTFREALSTPTIHGPRSG